MSNDQYRLQAYENFDALSHEFHKMIDDGEIGPWYFCKVMSLGTWREDIDNITLRSLSVFGFKVTKWMADNKKENDLIIYLEDEGQFLVFNNEALIKKFKHWYKKQDITESDDIKLWPNKDDFYDEIQETGKICIEQKFDAGDLLRRYRSGILTEQVFDVYSWMEDNLGKVYYWGGNFYFVDEKDAVAFKLKWM